MIEDELENIPSVHEDQIIKKQKKDFISEVKYYSGNLKYFLLNIFHVFFRLRVKILGLIMLAVPSLYFNEGKALVLNLTQSITNKGLIDIFYLFAFGAILITWCSYALYMIIFK